jgi:Helix-turn-helix
MIGERVLAVSNRFLRLAARFRDKQYRDAYVAAHAREVLAKQMRNFRGGLSQAEYAERIGKQKTVIGRLENPAYTGWSLRTMLDIARKMDVAVFVRFVDFPTFLKYSGDISESALQPMPYNPTIIAQSTSYDTCMLVTETVVASADRSRWTRFAATNSPLLERTAANSNVYTIRAVENV